MDLPLPAAGALASDDRVEFWYQAGKYVADARDRRDDTSSNDRWRHVGDRIARGALHQEAYGARMPGDMTRRMAAASASSTRPPHVTFADGAQAGCCPY